MTYMEDLWNNRFWGAADWIHQRWESVFNEKVATSGLRDYLS